jgi:hypothetical protein
MRAREFITESVTFTPAVEKDMGGQKVWTSSDWESKQMEPCFMCDGTGKETHDGKDYPCMRCDGKGEKEEWNINAPELNVSNANRHTVLSMMGIPSRPDDYSGLIRNHDLPKIMRRLITLKNTSTERYTSPDYVTRGQMGVQGTDDQGVTHIGRKGPTMYDMGVSQEQVDRYLDALIQLVKFAQENNASIHWG